MFVVETTDGRRFTEDDCYWHDVPADIVISRMGIKFTIIDHGAGIEMNVADDVISGFDEYGFQKYDIVPSDPSAPRVHGAQILAVSHGADRFMVLDVNMSTGQRVITWRPISEMTYKQELLRTGARS